MLRFLFGAGDGMWPEGARKPWGMSGEWLGICLGYDVYVSLPFQLLMLVIISWDFCLLLLASIQLIRHWVQGIGCAAADVGEMTLYKWLASHCCEMLERVVRSSSDTDLKAPANKLVVLLVVPVTSSTFISLNASSRLSAGEMPTAKKKCRLLCSLGSQNQSW